MSNRHLQIDEFIRGALAEVLSKEIEVPFDFLITVTGVEAAPDLKTANVTISILPFSKSEDGMAFLINNRKEIQRQLGLKTKKLRKTPVMRFIMDEAEEKASNIHRILDNLN
jgi:ribosome-binding factor A